MARQYSDKYLTLFWGPEPAKTNKSPRNKFFTTTQICNHADMYEVKMYALNLFKTIFRTERSTISVT